MNKILLLEDDLSLIDGLKYSLEKNGFIIDIVRSVGEAKERIKSFEYNLLLLDVILPDGTGFEICESVRAGGGKVPIIFLTSADEEVNIIRGLDGGGDDYITKPFKLGELCSRIKALLRRAGTAGSTHIGRGGISINLLNNSVMLDGKELSLTGMEFRLLCMLVKNTGMVLTRNVILNGLWDSDGNFVDNNTLSVYIRRLREKVEEDPSRPKRLVTVRGFGYRWNEVAK